MATPPSARPDAAAFFLVGPTASGKSAVAQWIAERTGWDILSADSMQVYRGMDIGTAKPTPADRARARYHGLDLVDPVSDFSVADYVAHARAALREAAAAGRRVMVVGGTGLYVKALVSGLDDAPPPDPARRAHWTALLEREGAGALQAALRERAPEAFAALADPDNARRLIRALERAEAGAPPPAAWRQAAPGAPLAGLELPPPVLHSRIESRVRDMYGLGLVEEVRGLRRTYGELSRTARQAIGYAEALDCLDGRCSAEEAQQRTALRTRQLAKRQRTWFRHQVSVAWIGVAPGAPAAAAAERVLAQWEQHGPTRIIGL